MSATVITHNGSFHCDEVLAYALIRYLYGTVNLIRTRDLSKIAEMVGKDDVFIIDVGGVFNPLTHEYDHHQSTFSEMYDERSTVPLSSAGLVFKYHAFSILSKFVAEMYPTLVNKINIGHLKNKVYDGWVKHIDANDNGVSQSAGASRFAVSSAIYSRVGRMNLRWNSPSKTDKFAEEEAFIKAADVVIAEFIEFVDTSVNDHFLSEAVVEDAILKTALTEQILCLPYHCPWKGHIVRLEKKHNVTFSFIAYPEDAIDGKWRLHAIPIGGFINRYVIPAQFRSAPGVTFIHNAGFIAAAESRDAIMNLGKLCIDYYASSQM